METAKKQKFYFHPVGFDFNGNGQPNKTDPGWVVVEARCMNEAIKLLPEEPRTTLKNFWEMYEKICVKKFPDFSEIMQDTCGWGVGFSLMDQEAWEEKEF